MFFKESCKSGVYTMQSPMLQEALRMANGGKPVQFMFTDGLYKIVAEVRFIPKDGWQFSSPRTGCHYVRDDGTPEARRRATDHLAGFLARNDWSPDEAVYCRDNRKSAIQLWQCRS
jgi:hypothetical protein